MFCSLQMEMCVHTVPFTLHSGPEFSSRAEKKTNKENILSSTIGDKQNHYKPI